MAHPRRTAHQNARQDEGFFIQVTMFHKIMGILYYYCNWQKFEIFFNALSILPYANSWASQLMYFLKSRVEKDQFFLCFSSILAIIALKSSLVEIVFQIVQSSLETQDIQILAKFEKNSSNFSLKRVKNRFLICHNLSVLHGTVFNADA